MSEKLAVYQVNSDLDRRTKVLNDIHQERLRQDQLHPQPLNLAMRFVTAMEESGEVAEALQEGDKQHLYEEAIQAAASWVRFAEQVLADEN